MGFSYDAQKRIFRVDTAAFSYVMALNAEGKLCQLYYGAPLYGEEDFHQELEALSVLKPSAGVGSEIAYHQEYPVQEAFDYGTPSLFALFPDGSRGVHLRYESHRLSEDGLTILLSDENHPLRVELRYRLAKAAPILKRSVRISYEGEGQVRLRSMLSAAYTLPARVKNAHFLTGAWGGEYNPVTQEITPVRLVLQNSRGTCASHQALPFVTADCDAGEDIGEVYFFGLMWSGDHAIMLERLPSGMVRVSGGVSSPDLEWNLTKEHPFEGPVFFTGYTPRGFDGMSRLLYDWEYDELLPQNKVKKLRPVIYNSWYPFEFGVTEENCLAMLDGAKAIGAELFVIDDGWMRGRTHDSTGLGDWYADEERFPRGLSVIADACHEKGLLFGLWVEPEMCNPDSELFRAHPDWILKDAIRDDALMRNQLVLDLSKEEVARWCMGMLDRLIHECKLDYLKWDMNRYLSAFGTDSELRFRYISNLYRVWEHMQKQYPDVLYENCASGAGRADFGMLPYSDRINRSDNADPVDVLRLHEGFTRLFVPKLAGGAGNISPCPNGINGRRVPLDFRAAVGMNGSLSVGINLTKCASEEITEIRRYVDRFKELRPLLEDCYVLRLRGIDDGKASVLQYLKRDGSSLVILAYAHGLRHWEEVAPVCLRGLEEKALYQDEEGRVLSGSSLMHKGIPKGSTLELRGDYSACILVYRKLP